MMIDSLYSLGIDAQSGVVRSESDESSLGLGTGLVTSYRVGLLELAQLHSPAFLCL